MQSNWAKPSLIKRHKAACAIMFSLSMLGGAWLVFGPSDKSQVTGLGFGCALAGFVLVFAGILGLLAVFIRAIEQPMPKEMVAEWEIERLAGRHKYILRFFLRGIPVVAIFTLFAFYSRLNGEYAIKIDFVLGLAFFAAVSLVVLYLTAHRFWAYNERQHERLAGEEKRADR